MNIDEHAMNSDEHVMNMCNETQEKHVMNIAWRDEHLMNMCSSL